LLGNGAEYTGAWEDVEKYSTVAIAIIGTLATDGTLYIESSQDGGTTVNSVPFAVPDTTFDLPHIWNVVEKYIRIRYVNGTTPMTGAFQMQTKYSNAQSLGLLQEAGDTITPQTDLQIVKAVGTGTNPDGTYKNQVVSGVDNANSSQTTLGISESFVGDWVNVSGFHGITVLVDGTSAGTADGTLVMEFSHDGVTANRTISIPVADVTAAAPRTLGVVAEYFRVTYDNGTTATTSFDLQTMFHTVQVSLVSRLDQALAGNEDVANVRSVLMGQDPSGNFGNVAITETTNDAGTYQNLNVVSGARPSQLAGRVKKSIIMDSVAASALQYTVTAGKTLYITDLLISVINTANGTDGDLKFEDGTIAAQPVVLPLRSPEAPTGGTGTVEITHTFAEPLEFDTGVWYNEAAGTLIVSGVLIGYEE
jgi:hypothetical protein